MIEHPLKNQKIESLEQLISQFYHSMVVGHPVKIKCGYGYKVECADILHHIHLIETAKNAIDEELENLEDAAQMEGIRIAESMIEIG